MRLVCLVNYALACGVLFGMKPSCDYCSLFWVFVLVDCPVVLLVLIALRLGGCCGLVCFVWRFRFGLLGLTISWFLAFEYFGFCGGFWVVMLICCRF